MTTRSTFLHARIMQSIMLLIAFAFIQTTVNAQNWNQLGMDIDGEAADDQSGQSVSLSADGSTLAIGARLNDGNGTDAGHVRVYQLISGDWVQQGADIDGEAAGDASGHSVSLSSNGSIVAIGAARNDGNGIEAGHVRVYKLILGVWTQQGADIDGEAAGDRSGESVSLSADGLTLAIGAHTNGGNGFQAGHVRVYKFMSGVWIQQGVDIDGEAAGDESGLSVSLRADGLTLAIGAPGIGAGQVRVYQWSGTAWTQQGADIDGEAAGDASGYSVSLSADGLTLAIGTPYNEGNGVEAGHVRVYKFMSGDWVQQGADIDGEAAGDLSGGSVSLSADGLTLAIGAPGNGGNGLGAGHVRVYKFILGVWTQQCADIDGAGAGDLSGGSVSLSADGSNLAIGAIGNDGNGTDAGHVRVYVGCTVGIVENDFGAGFTVHPNPTGGLITITLGQQYSNLNVVVRDITGRQVATFNFGIAKQATFEIEGARGLYFVEVTSAEGRSARLRVIKN